MTGGTRVRRWLRHPIARIVLGSAVCLIIPGIINAAVLRPLLGLLPLPSDALRSIRFALNIAILLATYRWYFHRVENRVIHELGRASFVLDSAAGLALGLGGISLVLLTLYVAGAYTVLATGSVMLLIYPLVYQSFIAVTEELVFRGVVYRIVEASLGTHLALVISATLFSVPHLANFNATALTLPMGILYGLTMGMLFTLTKRLWVPILCHAGWNFGLVLYGTPVSGMEEFLPYALLHSRVSGPGWLTGGSFGPEHSVVGLGMLLALFAIAYVLARRSGRIVPRTAAT